MTTCTSRTKVSTLPSQKRDMKKIVLSLATVLLLVAATATGASAQEKIKHAKHQKQRTMTTDQIKAFIEGGEWTNIAPEVRPSITRDAAGNLKPFYLTRSFRYTPGDEFECTVINYADANAKVPLAKIVIKGHLKWEGEHPIAQGAQKVDYVADVSYEVTPLHQGFADAVNQLPAAGLNKWEVNVMQDVKGKGFPAFGLTEGQIYVDYDLIYIYNDMLFNGSKNVDGQPFDKPENRPTNLQLPLVRNK